MPAQSSPEARFQDSQWKPLAQANYANQLIAHEVGEGRVLDLGCGDGTLLSLLKKRGVEGVGLDLSEKAVSIARGRGLDCRTGDLSERLPFEDGAFGSVLLADVLEHVYRPGDVLKEAARVSSRYIYVSTPNFVSFPARLQVALGRVPENNTPRDGHVYWMTDRVLAKLTDDVGLVPDRIWDNTVWQFKPGVGVVTRALARARPSFFALSFIRRYAKR